MHLSFKDKAHILTSNFTFWIGAFFFLIGSTIFGFFLPLSDFASVKYYLNPVAVTTGYAAGTEPTNCSEGDVPILAIFFRYNIGGQQYWGRCYSNALSIKQGDSLQVEYLESRPEYARITGTRNAPYEFWVAFLSGSAPLLGLALIYSGMRQSKESFTIIADAEAVIGNHEKTRVTKEGIDGDDVYYLLYRYYFDGLPYVYTMQTNYPAKYGTQELLFIQRSRPSNAIIATDLPIAIRERLLSSING